MAVELRPVREDDVAALTAMHRAHEVRRWWGEPPPGFPFDDANVTPLVIVADGAPAGYIQYGEEDDDQTRTAWVDLFVDPQRHRQGIGVAAVRELVRFLVEERGHHRVVIDPEATNHAAIRCYERAGFRTVGTAHRSWRPGPGEAWRDCLLMELEHPGVLVVWERGRPLAFPIADVLRFHGHGSPGGVAIAYQVLRLALADRAPRREITVRTAFPGPGARDAFECVLRAVSDGRYTVDPVLTRPELGPERERFVFEVGRTVLILREGFITPEFDALARKDGRSAEEEARLDALKLDLTDRVLERPAHEVLERA